MLVRFIFQGKRKTKVIFYNLVSEQYDKPVKYGNLKAPRITSVGSNIKLIILGILDF